MGYRRIGLEILGIKMLFIEIHICLASLHLAWTTTYAWSRWSRLVISNFLLLPSVFAVFSRLDSFYTTSTQRILYVSRLFLVSLVPWIDKPWGNTLREKLHEPCACGIQIGALRSVNKLFWRRCRGTIDLRSNLTCIRKYFFFLIFLFDLFRSLIFCAN